MKTVWIMILGFLVASCSSVENTSNVVSDEMKRIAEEKTPNSMLTFMNKEGVKSFISYMGEKHHYDEDLLIKEFSQITPRQQVIKKSNNQPEVITPYHKYKARFLNESRIKSGVAFLQENKIWLDRAEKEFGVPAEIIVAIAGVETFYGRITGNKDVFTSLSTLAFDYPRRGKYFQSELEAFLLLAREKNWPISEVKGSYSGALGVAQFMPSNYRKLAIDFDRDGEIDLWGSSADAIGSIANYLKHKGWKAQRPILDSVTLHPSKGSSPEIMLWSNKQRKTFHYPNEWKKIGVNAPSSLPQLKSGLIRLRTAENKVSYWLAYNNFFALMSYNPSRRYTMAVIDLSKAIYEGNEVQ
ncbi:lytic murein transglycosylase B [Marinomonas sp. 2405UD68-3]|uniref:lytic murein transglycosylase B n=1 Tax=Marinomonas sp. 2405UD68-3 TaxID=3391835 RepID=UPI0039C972A4